MSLYSDARASHHKPKRGPFRPPPVPPPAGLLTAQATDVLLYLGSPCFDDLRQAGSHVSQYGTGVDSQAAHSEYQSSLLVVRAARVPLRAPKSMDFGTGSTSEAF